MIFNFGFVLHNLISGKKKSSLNVDLGPVLHVQLTIRCSLWQTDLMAWSDSHTFLEFQCSVWYFHLTLSLTDQIIDTLSCCAWCVLKRPLLSVVRPLLLTFERECTLVKWEKHFCDILLPGKLHSDDQYPGYCSGNAGQSGDQDWRLWGPSAGETLCFALPDHLQAQTRLQQICTSTGWFSTCS